MSTCISTAIFTMGLVLILEALVARTYFSSLEAMLVKFAFAAFFGLTALASKSPWLAEALSGDYWLFVVVAATGITLVTLYDLKRLVKRTDRHRRQRRRDSRRTTPARY